MNLKSYIPRTWSDVGYLVLIILQIAGLATIILAAACFAMLKFAAFWKYVFG